MVFTVRRFFMKMAFFCIFLIETVIMFVLLSVYNTQCGIFYR